MYLNCRHSWAIEKNNTFTIITCTGCDSIKNQYIKGVVSIISKCSSIFSIYFDTDNSFTISIDEDNQDSYVQLYDALVYWLENYVTDFIKN